MSKQNRKAVREGYPTTEDFNPRKLLLEKEINKITDGGVRRFIKNCMDEFPDYFWNAPSSGSGKYHPEDEFVEGGLVLHTRRVIKVVEDLVYFHELNIYEKDVLIAAAILHDSWSKGWYGEADETMSDIFHPLYPPQKFPYNTIGVASNIDEKMYDEIMTCVVSHSARWSVTKWLNLDKKLPRIFQLADFIASRRHIIVTI